MIPDDIQQHINYLKSKGFGWSKFAESVEKQGNVSEEQIKTILSMVRRVSTFQRSKIETRAWANSLYGPNPNM